MLRRTDERRHLPELTSLYRLVQPHVASLIAQTDASAGCKLPQFSKDKLQAFLEFGILAKGFFSPRCTQDGTVYRLKAGGTAGTGIEAAGTQCSGYFWRASGN